MEKTLKIEGMMCPHCEARVKKALEAVPGVSEARVDHKTGTARLSLDGAALPALEDAVKAAGYTVTGVEE